MKILISFLLILSSLPTFASTIKVMTFNAGSTEAMAKSDAKPGEFSKKTAKIADEFYGNGISWLPAVKATKEFIQKESPDIIGFQEVFDSTKCIDIPNDKRKGFICESWNEDSGLTIEEITNNEYQIACHLSDSEKCIAVKKAFGYIEGCIDQVCLDFLDGVFIKDCGGRSRVGRATVVTHNGERHNVIHVHGTSGFKKDDMKCRKKQYRYMFNDLAEGSNNIVLGDFNTDTKLRRFDKSAKELRKLYRGNGFVKLNGNINQPTYGKVITLDFIFADSLNRVDCRAHGVSRGTKNILYTSYFDHVPLVCTLTP